jgi:hypothetical protein
LATALHLQKIFICSQEGDTATSIDYKYKIILATALHLQKIFICSQEGDTATSIDYKYKIIF